MNQFGKVIVFVVVALVILVTLTLLKEGSRSGGGGAMPILWIGAVLIPIIWRSLFGKKKSEEADKGTDIKLRK